MKYHAPVLLKEVVDFLNPQKGDLIIDATIGGGGHTKAFLEKGARVLGIDRDPDAVKYLNEESEISGSKGLKIVQGNFSNIAEIAKREGFEKVKGILFDLGVSSRQLENAQRGFSFKKVGPLDMRMDPSLEVKAKDIVNNFDKRRLNEILKTYGQEKLSWPIASAICSAREIEPIETTGRLAQIVSEVYAKKHERSKIDPSTKTFQALRIVVNSELLNLEESLPQTVKLLKIGGRLAVISFHSLEDAQVKRFFKQEESLKTLIKKPIGPGTEEILRNPRARSAKLRVAEKIQ